MTARVVVFGSTGHFGARISRRLARRPGIDVVVTSRTLGKAQSLAAGIGRVTAAALDQDDAGLAQHIADLRADIVIHTAGPYQGQDYRVAEACIAAGCHYIDLADGRDFVTGFAALDSRAKEAGVILVTGASTLPGVSSAVVDKYRNEFSQIDEIAISIAPAHQTPRGAGTIRAVLSYCGLPFDTWQDGAWRTVYGWQDLRRQHYPALGRRLSGVCDVPDLALFPDFVPGVRTVSFHAALEAPWEQLGLWCMAWLTRWHIVRNWSRFVPTVSRWSRRLLRFGSVRGGMHVRLTGAGPMGQPRRKDWYLVADDNHGPEIPCTPAIIVALGIVDRRFALPGAYPCLGLFTIGDLLEELSEFRIESSES